MLEERIPKERRSFSAFSRVSAAFLFFPLLSFIGHSAKKLFFFFVFALYSCVSV
jgi:hypothetical protein